ncbi:MAG: class I SAM-dependent methyltransferase [Deltaproteobacteria bacterium]|nr:class I SAM-dependent methyltransferase [Deltaproteobacteria bacterium]
MAHWYLPPSLRRFAPRRIQAGPWMRHLALEYDLVTELAPQLFADVGAGNGVSFYAYCQALDDAGAEGIGYAFDNFPASGAEPPPPNDLEEVRAHGRQHHPARAYVVAEDPRGSIRHFDPETADLVRVDLSRNELASAELVLAWAARLRPGGLLVLAGATTAAAAGAIEALRRPLELLVFEGAQGIALHRSPGAAATRGPLSDLLFSEGRAAQVDEFYAHVHAHLSLCRRVAKLGELVRGRAGA